MGILENAKPENCFYCADGSVLHNLLELRQKLKTISPQAFYHHVSQSKNDFHNWIRDVFQDYEFANDILKAKTPAAAAATVDRHLKRAFLAEEEIEQAISKIIKARARAITFAPPAAAKRTKKQKPKRKIQLKKKRPQQKQPQKQRKHPQKIQRTKGKKKSTMHPNRAKHDWAQSPKVDLGNRKLNKKQRKKTGSRSDYGKRGKKQVNMWLKWLKLVPEL
ncbi:hypothetical protein HYY73_05830 [Candidatus Woesearchaeota archaeon]|nr:hypothetical protein [Candidatus Woesearchaeota archaeon]